MQIKRSFRLIFSFVLAISLVWVGFKPASSLATTSSISAVTTNTKPLSSEVNLIAQVETGEFVLPPYPMLMMRLIPTLIAKR